MLAEDRTFIGINQNCIARFQQSLELPGVTGSLSEIVYFHIRTANSTLCSVSLICIYRENKSPKLAPFIANYFPHPYSQVVV